MNGKKLVINCFIVLTFVALSLSATAASAQIKKVRLAIPTVDIVTLPLKMAQAKGFLPKGGIGGRDYLDRRRLGCSRRIGKFG